MNLTQTMSTVVCTHMGHTVVSTILRITDTRWRIIHHLTRSLVTVDVSTSLPHLLPTLAIDKLIFFSTETLGSKIVFIKWNRYTECSWSQTPAGMILTWVGSVEIIMLVLLHHHNISDRENLLSNLSDVASAKLVDFENLVRLVGDEVDRVFKHIQSVRSS